LDLPLVQVANKMQAAMSAMNGMLEGHQKGRADLYKQQKDIFETNQKLLDKKSRWSLSVPCKRTPSCMPKTSWQQKHQTLTLQFAEEGAGFLKSYYEKYGPWPYTWLPSAVGQGKRTCC